MKIINEAEKIVRGIFNDILVNSYNTNKLLDKLSFINKERVEAILNTGNYELKDYAFTSELFDSVNQFKAYKVWVKPITVQNILKNNNMKKFYNRVIDTNNNWYELKGYSTGSIVHDSENNIAYLKLSERATIDNSDIKLLDLLLKSSLLTETELKVFKHSLIKAMKEDGISENIIDAIQNKEDIVVNYLLSTVNVDNSAYRKYMYDSYESLSDAHKTIDYYRYIVMLKLLKVDMYTFISMSEKDILNMVNRVAKLDMFSSSVSQYKISNLYTLDNSNAYSQPVDITDAFNISSIYNMSVFDNKNITIFDLVDISMLSSILMMQQDIINLLKEPVAYGILNVIAKYPKSKYVNVKLDYNNGKKLNKRLHIEKAFQFIYYGYDEANNKYDIDQMEISHKGYTVTLDDYLNYEKTQSLSQLANSNLMYAHEFNFDLVNKKEYQYSNVYNKDISVNINKVKGLLYLKKDRYDKKGKPYYVKLTDKSLSTNKVTITEFEYSCIVDDIFNSDSYNFYTYSLSDTDFNIDEAYKVINSIFDLYNKAISDMDIFLGLLAIYNKQRFTLFNIENIIYSFVNTLKRNHFVLHDEILFIG